MSNVDGSDADESNAAGYWEAKYSSKSSSAASHACNVSLFLNGNRRIVNEPTAVFKRILASVN